MCQPMCEHVYRHARECVYACTHLCAAGGGRNLYSHLKEVNWKASSVTGHPTALGPGMKGSTDSSLWPGLLFISAP